MLLKFLLGAGAAVIQKLSMLEPASKQEKVAALHGCASNIPSICRAKILDDPVEAATVE